jgi:hypothetical protein
MPDKKHQVYLPRFVPKGELPRLDWADQLVDGYDEKYKGALPLFPEDPDTTAEYIAARYSRTFVRKAADV